MPSVLDAPERIEHVETHDLHIEKPRARGARPRFWHPRVHGITKHPTPMPHELCVMLGLLVRAISCAPTRRRTADSGAPPERSPQPMPSTSPGQPIPLPVRNSILLFQ